MNKQKIMAAIDSHKCIFKVVFGVLNKLPFNNSLGGGRLTLACLF